MPAPPPAATMAHAGFTLFSRVAQDLLTEAPVEDPCKAEEELAAVQAVLMAALVGEVHKVEEEPAGAGAGLLDFAEKFCYNNFTE